MSFARDGTIDRTGSAASRGRRRASLRWSRWKTSRLIGKAHDVALRVLRGAGEATVREHGVVAGHFHQHVAQALREPGQPRLDAGAGDDRDRAVKRIGGRRGRRRAAVGNFLGGSGRAYEGEERQARCDGHDHVSALASNA